MKGLVCRECGAQYPEILIHACEKCFGPLEVSYDFDAIEITRETISARERNLWRYRELLPILEESSIVDIGTGFSTLHRCKNLADSLGLKNLYVKDDTVNPTNSFKDRPSSVAVSKAREFGVEAVGCPSTGNLAAAVAAHAAKAGLPCYVFVPANTESNKVLQASTYGANIVTVDGTYDEVEGKDGEITRTYVPRKPDEIARFVKMTKNAIGYDPERGDQVEVVSMPFHISSLVEPKPDPMEKWRSLLEKVAMPLVLLIVAGAFLMFVVKPFIRLLSEQKFIAEGEGPVGELAGAAVPTEEDLTLKPIAMTDKERIYKLAQSDPERAADLVRRWLREEM